MPKNLLLPPLLAASLITGCATMPSGPDVLVLPGTGKSFQQFQGDDYVCQQFAMARLGGTSPNQAAAASGLASAAAGAAIGAAAGAAIGGGQGAAVGAGTGLATGALVGTGTASTSGYEAQQRYDWAYVQCMYAKGHRVPVSGKFTDSCRPPPPPPPTGNPPPAPPQ